MSDELAAGDIVQITNPDHHWYPALIIVSEPKSFGCQGYMIHVTTNDPNISNNPAYIRLAFQEFERVGQAVVLIGPTE